MAAILEAINAKKSISNPAAELDNLIAEREGYFESSATVDTSPGELAVRSGSAACR
jgi:hypothetical protein